MQSIMSNQQKQAQMQAMLATAGPYPMETFNFVNEGLRYTTDHIHGEYDSYGSTLDEPDHHISGQQLCLGLCDYAIDQFGMLALPVLNQWHVHRTEDFGRIVFALIEAGFMRQHPEDTLEDFRAVYDFQEVFCTEEIADRIGQD